MDHRRNLIVAAIAAGSVVTGSGTATAAASLQLEVTATSTPTFWLEDRTYSVVVTNDGDEPVSGVTGQVASPELPIVTVTLDSPTVLVGDADDVLDPGEQWQYDVTVPTISQWGFSAEGTVPGGTVSASASSARETYPSAFPFAVSIAIDNDFGPFPGGTDVPFAVTVTNDADFGVTLACVHALGETTLAGSLAPIGAPATDGNGDAVLDPGEAWTWTVTHTVTTTGDVLHVRCDHDLADTPTGGLRQAAVGPPVALEGEPLMTLAAEPTSELTRWLQDRQFELTLANRGALAISGVDVTVAMDMPPDGFAGTVSAPTVATGDDDDVLDPGEVWTYTAVGIVRDNVTFTATGDAAGETVSASDRVANGQGADLLGAISIAVEQVTADPVAGQDVDWQVRITNAIGVELDVRGFGAAVFPPGTDDTSAGFDDLAEVGLNRALGPTEEWVFIVTRPVATDGSFLAVQFAVARVDAPDAVDGSAALQTTSAPVALAATSSTTTLPLATELPATGTERPLGGIAAALVAIGAAVLLASRRRPAADRP